MYQSVLSQINSFFNESISIPVYGAFIFAIIIIALFTYLAKSWNYSSTSESLSLLDKKGEDMAREDKLINRLVRFLIKIFCIAAFLIAILFIKEMCNFDYFFKPNIYKEYFLSTCIAIILFYLLKIFLLYFFKPEENEYIYLFAIYLPSLVEALCLGFIQDPYQTADSTAFHNAAYTNKSKVKLTFGSNKQVLFGFKICWYLLLAYIFLFTDVSNPIFWNKPLVSFTLSKKTVNITSFILVLILFALLLLPKVTTRGGIYKDYFNLLKNTFLSTVNMCMDSKVSNLLIHSPTPYTVKKKPDCKLNIDSVNKKAHSKHNKENNKESKDNSEILYGKYGNSLEYMHEEVLFLYGLGRLIHILIVLFLLLCTMIFSSVTYGIYIWNIIQLANFTGCGDINMTIIDLLSNFYTDNIMLKFNEFWNADNLEEVKNKIVNNMSTEDNNMSTEDNKIIDNTEKSKTNPMNKTRMCILVVEYALLYSVTIIFSVNIANWMISFSTPV